MVSYRWKTSYSSMAAPINHGVFVLHPVKQPKFMGEPVFQWGLDLYVRSGILIRDGKGKREI